MGVTAFHSRTATGADDPAYDVQLQRDWNAAHLLTLNAVGSEISNAFGTNGNVTFTYDGTFVNANAGTAAPSPINVSAGTTSNNVQTLVFSNSNGISFGLNGSTITGTVQTNYLTTAMKSDAATISNVNLSAGTTSNNLSAFVFSNSNNVSFGLNGSTVTASASVASSLTNIKVSAGTASQNRSDITFNDSNGISFGLGTGANAGVITGTVKTDYQSSNANYLTSQSNQAASASNGSFTFQTVGFSNANNVTFGTSAGSIVTASVAAQSTQSAIKGFGATNTGNTAGNTGISSGIDWVIAGTNNITVSESTAAGGPNTLWLSAPNPGAGGGIGGISNSQTMYTSGTVVLTEGGGAITIGSDTGQHFSFSVPQTSSIVGTSGISVSSAGSTISIQPTTESYYAYPANGPDHHTQTWAPLSNTSYIWPFKVDDVVGFNYLKWLQTVSLASMASIATAVNNTKSYTQQGTYNFNLYTRQTGANSQSLSNFLSTSATSSMGITIGQNANGSQWTVTHAFAFPASNGTTSTSASYATTLSNVNVSTTHLTFMTGIKFQAFPWSTTITDNQYFLMHGLQTAQTTNGNASLSNMALTCSGLAYSLLANAYADFGSATNSSIGALPGVGSFTKAATGSTAALGFANITTSATHLIPYITLQAIA